MVSCIYDATFDQRTVLVPVTREAQPRLTNQKSVHVILAHKSSILPVRSLPCKQEGRCQHRIRVEFCEIGDAIVQSLQGDARVMKREVSSLV